MKTRTVETAICVLCSKELPIMDFTFKSKPLGLRHNYCKPCGRTRRHNNPKYAESKRRAALKFHYGITLEDYGKLLAEQEGKCKLCGTETPGNKRCKNFNVDHDHQTGEIRGLLCGPCNLIVGYVEKSPELVIKILAYLKSSKG